MAGNPLLDYKEDTKVITPVRNLRDLSAPHTSQVSPAHTSLTTHDLLWPQVGASLSEDAAWRERVQSGAGASSSNGAGAAANGSGGGGGQAVRVSGGH